VTDWRWPNFTPDEMACQHCGAKNMDPEFMDQLQALRDAYGRPMAVSSAYRCPDHPIEDDKDPEDEIESPHETGRCVDVLCSHLDAYELLGLALEMGFTGIGVNQRGDSRFLHLDTLEDGPRRPRPHVWSY